MAHDDPAPATEDDPAAFEAGDDEEFDGPAVPELPTCYCEVSGLVDLLSRKYTMQLVCVLGVLGRSRFGDFEDALPAASTSTLSARLDDLEAAGLVTREQYDEIPPRVEYELTAEGEALCERLQPLLEWVAER